VVDALGITDEQLLEAERRAATVLRSRAEIFRRARPRIPLTGRTVVIVDDGIATGATARAACEVVRASGATRVVVATPVAPAETVAELEDLADEVVCLSTPHPFYAIGPFYEDFAQVDDDVVVALLDRAAT
ncbi:MAG: phosphoribosyltransferase family protein, partial [Actinomycetes bacterium]